MIIQQIFSSIIVLIASTLAVLSGFGFVLFSAPLLSYIYEPVHTVFLTITLSTVLLGLLFLTTDIHKHMNTHVVAGLVVCSLVGIPIGIMVLPFMNDSLFKIGLGILTVVYVIFRSFGYNFRIPNRRLSIIIAGILGGAFSTSTGFSALPIILLLSNFDMDPYQDRATLSGFVFITGGLSLIAFAVTGTLQTLSYDEVLWLVPAMLIGFVLGMILVNRLAQERLKQAVLIYLGVIGLLAIIPALL